MKWYSKLMKHTAKQVAVTLIVCMLFQSMFRYTSVEAAMLDGTHADTMQVDETTYPVSVAPTEHGTIEILNDVTSSGTGGGVEFALTPERGYGVADYWVTDAKGNTLVSEPFLDSGHYIFYMEESAATIHAEFIPAQLYGITAESDGHATVSFIDGSDGNYSVGNDAYLNITPHMGYVIDTVTWENADKSKTGELTQIEENQYTFTMPGEEVFVSITTKDAVSHTVSFSYNNQSSDNIVSLSKETAVKGEKVFVTFSNHIEGYTYNVAATTEEGESIPISSQVDGSWYFFMPNDNVSIYVSEMSTGSEPDKESTEQNEDAYLISEPLVMEETEVIPANRSLFAMVRNNRASTRAVSHLQTTTFDGKKETPSVTITKDAHWTDIEEGYAEITLTEEDTSAYSETPVDFIIALDRSDSTLIDLHYTHWYTSAGLWLAGETPCQNPNHCYKLYDNNFYFLMTWYFGVKIGETGLTYISYTDNNGNMAYYMTYNYHYNRTDGTHIGFASSYRPDGTTIYSYSYPLGCYGRREIEMDAAITILDKIKEFEQRNNADKRLPISRVAFWAFGGKNDSHDVDDGITGAVLTPAEVASGPQTVNGVDFSDKGLSAYIGWTQITSGYDSLKNKVNSVGYGGGTNYGGSFDLAYQLIKSREGTAYEHVPVRFIMLTDGMPDDDHATLTTQANRLKNYDKAEVTLSIVGVGMPDVAWSNTADLPYIKSLTTQNLHIVTADGKDYYRANSYFPTNQYTETDAYDAVQTLAAASSEISAENKVYTDYVSDYYDVVSVSTANGTISNVGNKVTWNITSGQSKKYTATITVRLKDAYRYLISDTLYPTNTSASLEYDVHFGGSGDFYDPNTLTIDTPILPYGTVEIKGDKYWGVENSELETVKILAQRRIVDTEDYYTVGSAYTVDNKFFINRRDMDDTIPLVLYNNNEERYEYRTIEDEIDYYYDAKNDLTVSDNGLYYETKHLNMPNGADANGGVSLKKLDYHTGKTIKDAVFTVFAYSGSGDESDLANYEVYCYTPYDNPGDYDYKGIVTTVSYNSYMEDPESYDVVELLYDEDQNQYVNTQPLYYTPENKGLFKIVETKTPKGYYGDWKDGITPDENSTYLDRNSYDVVINPIDAHQEFIIYNEDMDNTFRNKAIRGEIVVNKTGDVATGYTEDENGNKLVTYETKGLPGAWYVVRAAEDIYDPQGDLLYHKGDIVEPRESKQTHMFKLSDLDLSVYGNEEESTHLVHVGETVSDNLLVPDEEGNAIKGTIVTKTDYMDEDYVAADLFDEFVLNKETGELIFCDGDYTTDKVFVTDADGIVKVEFLDQGSYEVVEVKAPTGYVRGRSFTIDVTADGTEYNRPTNSAYIIFNCTNDWTPVVVKEVSFFNERQKPATPGIPEEPIIEKDNNPSIMITKKADKEFYFPGEEVTYTVTVSNNGDVDLKDVVVDDVMDELPDSRRVVATFDSLLIGEYQTFTYNYTIPETDKDGTVHDNVATVVGTSELDEEFNIPAKTVTDQDDAKIKVKTGLGILKTTDRKLYMNGETINYTIYVTNNTVVSANTLDDMEGYKKEVKDKTLLDLVVEDKLLTAGVEDLTYVSTDMPERVSVMDDGNILIDYLEPQEVCILTYTARITDDFTGDVVDNEVKVTSSDGQTDDDDERVYVKNPEIKVTKLADKKDFSQTELTDSVSDNNIVNYTITVTNTGDCDLEHVRLQDTVLTTGNFQNDVTMTLSGNSVANTEENAKWFEDITVSGNSANIGLLPVGATKTLTYTYVLTPEDAGKKIPNVVVAKGDTIPEHPDEPIITVTDKDDEKVNAGIAVGLQKLSDKGGTPTPTEGAVFAMYAAEDIVNIEGTVIFPKDMLIETAITDKYGYANFTSSQLPLGEYVVKEVKAPQGCYPSDMIVYLHFDDYKYDDSVAIIHDGGIFRNSGVRLLVYLYDDNTMMELANAQLEVTDVSGNSIDSWVTKNTDGDGYVVYGCDPGVEYILREKTAREGYVNEIVRDLSDKSLSTNSISKTEIGFMIPEEAPQTVNVEDEEMYGKIIPTTEPNTYRLRITNDFVEGTLRIYKSGEYLDAWNFFEKAKHFIYSVYTFFTGPLGDIEFTVTANEDIYHPDGVTGLLYKEGDIVDVGVKSIRSKAVALTDDAGLATFEQMYLGEYTVSETRGKEGLFATAPINFSLAYLDENTPIVYATEEGMSINNVQQVVQVNITKVDRDTLEVLPGAEFELYTAEDIKNRDGKVITKKDTLLESGIITDEKGEAHVESVLAVGPTYYLKEVKAPTGYKIDEENLRIEFSTTPENFTDEYMIFNFTVKNTRNDDKLVVDKTAPTTATVGQSIRYDVVTVKNESRVPVDKFTLQDTLPDNVYMTTLYTGSYNEKVTMNVMYKTNLSSDWKIWQQNISSSQGVELTTSSLKLSEKEYVTEFAIDYGTVPAKFSANAGDHPYYFVTIGNAKVGTQFVNKIKLTGYVNGEKLESEDATVTRITNPRKTPRTGDDDMMFGFFLAMMILALIALGGYCAYNHYQKKKGPQDDYIRPKKTLFPKKVPNVPLSELVEKQKK